jgi:hypothetical protein
MIGDTMQTKDEMQFDLKPATTQLCILKIRMGDKDKLLLGGISQGRVTAEIDLALCSYMDTDQKEELSITLNKETN